MKPLTVIATVLLLTGCATQQYRDAQTQCEYTAIQKYPPLFQQQLVHRTKPIEVATGDMDCQTKGDKTRCRAQTRTEYIPYTTLESVDVNDPARRAAAGACTTSTCLQTYGNSSCTMN